MVKDSNNNIYQEWSAKNLDLMHLVKSSNNKPLSIPRLIPTPDAAINQVGSLLIGLNNANIGKSSRENTIIMDFPIRNKGMEESNWDAKVGLEV